MKRIFVFTLTLVSCAVTQSSAIAQTQVEVHACTKHGDTYNCDRPSFDQVLRITKTVSIQVPPLNAASLKQLQQLAASLGKTVQSEPADLTLVLTNPDPDGFYAGPSGRKLAAINVYYKASPSDPAQLIWTESYYGQPDTAWPVAVHAVIEQFRQDAKRP
ncbi:MAG TPA: hypothetical protein VF742_14460 [Terracidiphilus sp.]|jgi:hypothetical protein